MGSGKEFIAGLALALAAGAPLEAQGRELVAFAGYSPGTIVVKTSDRRLYLALPGGRAIRYSVGVGRQGKQWSGATRVKGKHVNPSFSPPAEVKRDLPHLPAVIPPGPRNPLGPRALTLAHDQYAIHGTNRPDSIGKFVSYGCIRMQNADIMDLFNRVRVGTKVVVLP